MFKTPQVSDTPQVFFFDHPDPFAALVTKVNDPGPAGSIEVATFDPDTGAPRILKGVPHKDHPNRTADQPFWDVA